MGPNLVSWKRGFFLILLDSALLPQAGSLFMSKVASHAEQISTEERKVQNKALSRFRRRAHLLILAGLGEASAG